MIPLVRTSLDNAPLPLIAWCQVRNVITHWALPQHTAPCHGLDSHCILSWVLSLSPWLFDYVLEIKEWHAQSQVDWWSITDLCSCPYVYQASLLPLLTPSTALSCIHKGAGVSHGSNTQNVEWGNFILGTPGAPDIGTKILEMEDFNIIYYYLSAPFSWGESGNLSKLHLFW